MDRREQTGQTYLKASLGSYWLISQLEDCSELYYFDEIRPPRWNFAPDVRSVELKKKRKKTIFSFEPFLQFALPNKHKHWLMPTDG